uniref:Uncharacterized protein n=1 Tax=Desulfovibrio sp. U5L TaxID=596152 RepID=I2Q3V0_9BACT
MTLEETPVSVYFSPRSDTRPAHDIFPCWPPGRENGRYGPRQPGRMTNPASACYSPTMEWIIIAALAVGVFALVAVLVLRIKRQDSGTVPGLFHFDRYKQNELTQRGVFDKTKWH